MEKRKAFTLIEIAFVLGLITLTAIILIPSLIEDNKKLDVISKWKNSYKNIEYIFSAIGAQVSETDKIAFEKAKSEQEKETLFIELINPYFRITNAVEPNLYKVSYLNGSFVKNSDEYYVSNLYYTTSGNIVGVKWLNNSEYSKNIPLAILLYDLNGIKGPNRWGVDIFGVNIFQDKMEPVGKLADEELVKKDCSKLGKGITCSYYYYIYGGNFN